MATRMQQRRGTAEQWLLADPVLAAGEIGFETDTGAFKIGDGVNNWTLLDYFETSATVAGTLEDYILLTEKGAVLGVATLDADGQVPAEQLANVDLTGYATEAYVSDAIDAVVGLAPETLDTLAELATALGDDPNAITAIQTDISTLQSDSSALQSDLTTLQSDLTTVQSDLTTVQSDLGTKADQNHTHTVADLTDITATAAELNYTSGVTSSIQTQLDSKLESADLSGYATETYVNDAVSALVDSAPGLLDTLNEIAAAINDDPDFFTNITSTITGGDATTLTDAKAYTDTREAAITTAYQTYADTAESDAVTSANAYTDGRETAITTAYQAYADQSETDAKAYTDTEISSVNTTISNLTTSDIAEGTNQYYTDTRARNAVSAGDGLDYDSATGVFSAGIGYGLKIDVNGDIQVDGDLIATDLDVANIIGDNTVDGTTGNTVTDRIASAVAGIVDSAPTTLDTLNELAAALGDDANFATTVTNQIAGKANTVHTHLLADLTDVTATVTELNYVSGVTSALQTQLDAKADLTTVTNSLAERAPIASPSFTGTVDFSSATVQGLEIPQPLHPFTMIG